jgi:hypothetical protein
MPPGFLSCPIISVGKASTSLGLTESFLLSIKYLFINYIKLNTMSKKVSPKSKEPSELQRYKTALAKMESQWKEAIQKAEQNTG